MGFTVSNADHVLKKTYASKGPESMVERSRKLLQDARKMDGFGGENVHYVPFVYASSNGITASFSTSQTLAGRSYGGKWALTRAAKFGTFNIDGEWLKACDDEGAFVKGIRHAHDSKMEAFGASLSRDLYGDGTGVIGRVAASGGVSGEVVTLATADDAKNFQVGMSIGFYDNSTGGTLQGGGGGAYATITKVDEDAGTITLTSGDAAATAAANDDYIAERGNYDACAKGLKAWIPKAAPSSTAFFGIDRTVDVARLSGSRVDGSALSITEGLLNLGEKIARRGGKPQKGYMNPTNFNTLIKERDQKVMLEPGKGTQIGFPYIELVLASGVCRIYPDQDCPSDASWLIDHNGFYIKHLKGFPHLDETDGQSLLRVYNANEYEGRIMCWWQPVFTAPAWSGVLKHS